jgi:hypothetical protein
VRWQELGDMTHDVSGAHCDGHDLARWRAKEGLLWLRLQNRHTLGEAWLCMDGHTDKLPCIDHATCKSAAIFLTPRQ